jgi:hypothetical protein
MASSSDEEDAEDIREAVRQAMLAYGKGRSRKKKYPVPTLVPTDEPKPDGDAP